MTNYCYYSYRCFIGNVMMTDLFYFICFRSSDACWTEANMTILAPILMLFRVIYRYLYVNSETTWIFVNGWHRTTFIYELRFKWCSVWRFVFAQNPKSFELICLLHFFIIKCANYRSQNGACF